MLQIIDQLFYRMKYNAICYDIGAVASIETHHRDEWAQPSPLATD